MSTREEIIAAMRLTATEAPRAVTVPKWGTVYVRDITVAEIEEQTNDTADKKDKHSIARAAARVLCDVDGTLLFNPNDPEDVALLARQPWKLLSAVITEGNAGN